MSSVHQLRVHQTGENSGCQLPLEIPTVKLSRKRHSTPLESKQNGCSVKEDLVFLEST